MKQGDLYLTKFDPSFGREYQGTRPALIIQNEQMTKHSNLVTLMPLSKKLANKLPSDVFVPKDAKNKLLHDSIIKVQHIYSYDKKRTLHKIGEVGSPTLRRVRGYLRKHFQL